MNHIICWKKRLGKKAVFILQLLLLFLAITFMFSYNTFGLPRNKLCAALHKTLHFFPKPYEQLICHFSPVQHTTSSGNGMTDDVTRYIKHLLLITLLNMWIPDATQPLAVRTAALLSLICTAATALHGDRWLYCSHCKCAWIIILIRPWQQRIWISSASIHQKHYSTTTTHTTPLCNWCRFHKLMFRNPAITL